MYFATETPVKSAHHAQCDNCQSVQSPSRRSALRLCTGAVLGIAASSTTTYAEEASEGRPEIGDYLVRADAEGDPTPLVLGDLLPGEKAILAFPFDARQGVKKDGSRLNRIIVLRLSPEQIHEDTRRFAAGGVLAYSAICTHQGCNIADYVAKDDAILCFCHFSKFRPTTGGEVISGPAPRSLPILPLKLDGQRLVVAGKFSSKPGATN